MKPNTMTRVLRQQTRRIIELEKMHTQQASQLRQQTVQIQSQVSRLWVTTKMVCTLRAQNEQLAKQMTSHEASLRKLSSLVCTCTCIETDDLPDME
jgi:hypothetical protein